MQCNPVEIRRRFGRIHCLHPQDRRKIQAKNHQDIGCLHVHRVGCLAYSTIVKIEVVNSSETSVNFHRTTRGQIAKQSTL